MRTPPSSNLTKSKNWPETMFKFGSISANQLKTMRRHPGISPEGERRCRCSRERPNSGPERCSPSAYLGPQTSLLIFGRTLSSKNSYFHISLGKDGTFVTWVPTFSFLLEYICAYIFASFGKKMEQKCYEFSPGKSTLVGELRGIWTPPGIPEH